MLRPEVHQDPASVRNKAGKPEPDGPFFGAGNGPKNGSTNTVLISPEGFKYGPFLGPQGLLFGIAGVRILEIGRLLCQHQVCR